MPFMVEMNAVQPHNQSDFNAKARYLSLSTIPYLLNGVLFLNHYYLK